MSQNPTLINGFEDVVTHIKQQEQRIKELEEKNKELKEEIEGDGWLKQGYKTDLSNSHKQQNRMVKEIVKLKEENKKLKEENKKLKMENSQVRDFIKNACADVWNDWCEWKKIKGIEMTLNLI